MSKKQSNKILTASILAVLLVAIAVAIKFSSRDQTADADSDLAVTSVGSDARSSKRPATAARPPVDLDEKFDKSLYRPITYTGGTPSGDDGARAYVRVPSTSSRVKLAPNSLGEYPTQPSGLEETVAVRLELPGVEVDTPVAVTTMDGGGFPGEEGPALLLSREKWGGITFRFTTSPNLGHHRLRVAVKGRSIRILDFYGMEDPSKSNL